MGKNKTTRMLLLLSLCSCLGFMTNPLKSAETTFPKNDEKRPATMPGTALEKEEPLEDKSTLEPKAKLLAERFSVEESVVISLRKENHMGWGEISHLLAISQKSGQSVETLVKLREDGTGWGEIAKKYNLKLGDINKDVHAIKKDLQKFDKGGRDKEGIPGKLRPEKQERGFPRGGTREKMQRPHTDAQTHSSAKVRGRMR